MSKRRRFPVLAWLRHLGAVMHVVFRLGVIAGVIFAAYRLLHWIGPAAEMQLTGEEGHDLQESRRAAFLELGRMLKMAMVILGATGLSVLFAVYCSRHPIVWVRSRNRDEPERHGGAKSERGSGDDDDDIRSHSRITIDPVTLEDDL